MHLTSQLVQRVLQKLLFYNLYIFATRYCIPLAILNYLHSVRSNGLIFKNKRFTPSGCKDIGKITIQFVIKTGLKPIKKLCSVET